MGKKEPKKIKIDEEDDLFKRRKSLTEAEAEVLIRRYDAKIIALLAYYALPNNPKSSYLLNAPLHTLYMSGSRGLLIKTMFDNHKKGILPITDDECGIIISHNYEQDAHKYDRLMPALKPDIRSRLETAIADYHYFIGGIYKTNDRELFDCKDFIKRITNFMDIDSLNAILNDSELDKLTRAKIYFSYVSNCVFSVKQRPVRDSHYYGKIKVSPKDEKMFGEVLNEDSDPTFVDAMLQIAALKGQVESLEYLKEFFPSKVAELVLVNADYDNRQISPLLYHYSNGNYLTAKRLIPLCNEYKLGDVFGTIFKSLLTNGMYEELLEVTSMESFKLVLDSGIIAIVRNLIPEDEYYMNKDTRGRDAGVGITDEFTERLVAVLRGKEALYDKEDMEEELDELLVVTRRTGNQDRDIELRQGRESLAQTLGALHDKAEDIIPCKHMIKEMLYVIQEGRK